ncbi:unnamed protein product [Clonostachys byssicola]|uniref:PLD phosphodiesterase domain-containing protein n=1 Tax=Clonostachys byssicola TaxID=160290 RepID=A0A9N9UKX4_9HYPO|nr:unnamed protein product [Clonostachys byssicola]
MTGIASEFPASFVGPWTELLQSHKKDQDHDFPNYYVDRPESLITSSVPKALYVGTGLTIFTRALLPAILNAKHSVNFVTCYWADSPTLNSFRETLIKLASARAENPSEVPLKVAIGFSSSGLFQKLLHTSSRGGHVYPPSKWPSLGLPNEELLRAGNIELSVKSLFFTPFSVMHPKYLIVDGAKAWVPSCNVSWERWFEGCVELEGDVVIQLAAFQDGVWGSFAFPESREEDSARNTLHATNRSSKRASMLIGGVENSATQSLKFPEMPPVPTIFLPSSHHRNPRFSVFPILSQSRPPITPLNAALLTLFNNAQRSINIVTPNVTAWPFMEALLAALQRGVDVQIRTSKNMMNIEQIITAETTTARCLDRFIKEYKALSQRQGDLEAQDEEVGRLEILYYQPLQSRAGEEDEPVLSHFKMTMVDEEYLVLGSGNQDRASWWTSQEIGILFYVSCFEWRRLWEGVLEKRAETLFDSLAPEPQPE